MPLATTPKGEQKAVIFDKASVQSTCLCRALFTDIIDDGVSFQSLLPEYNEADRRVRGQRTLKHKVS